MSNASSLDDLLGWGLDVGASAGAAYGMGIDFTQNQSGSVKGDQLLSASQEELRCQQE